MNKLDSGVRFDRDPIEIPDFGRFDQSLLAKLIVGSATLAQLTPLTAVMIDEAPDLHFACLRHELSDHYLALNSLPVNALRSTAEAEAAIGLEGEDGRLGAADPCGFRERLGLLNHHLTGNVDPWRRTAIRLGGDRAGNEVYFPPVSAIPGQLEKLRSVLADTGNPALLVAAVVYALLLNAHPFRDGNGRTARVLFNYVLRQGAMPRTVYLPLYEINRRSHGGHEIALRTAEIQGDWAPFLRYLLNVIQVCRAIAG